MASFHHHLKSGKKGTAAGHARYIAREGRFSDRADLIASGHGNMPDWASGNPQSFWRAGDKYERSNGAVFREHEIALPMELTVPQQLELAMSLIDGLVGNQPFQYAVHAPASSLEGCVNTHLHLMYSSRRPDGIARSPEQTFRRYNAKEPALGGARKDSGGRSPLELRDELINLRSKCAFLQNEALAKYGHSGRVDHRTLEQQGVARAAEAHLGPARIRRMDAASRESYVSQRSRLFES
ncbi:MAG: MobA/MobL family protein [Proteobacteria bacterium]|nr:MobA/MobL family protein [Pseudomonadota bacterium]